MMYASIIFFWCHIPYSFIPPLPLNMLAMQNKSTAMKKWIYEEGNMLQTVAAAKLLDLAGLSTRAASSTEAGVKTVLCSSDNAQSISSPLSLSACVLCECVSSCPWTWARGMCWEPGKTMGCHGNRLRLGKHTGAKHTVVCVGKNDGVGG